MADKLIISFDEYIKIVEKLAIDIHKRYKPTVLVGIMRGAAPIIDILSRILLICFCSSASYFSVRRLRSCALTDMGSSPVAYLVACKE